MWKPKIEPAGTGGGENRKEKANQENLPKHPHVGSAQRNWFKLTAGINGILPAFGGPLPFIPLLT